MPAAKKYSNSDPGVSAPAGRLLAVTPSDSSELTECSRGLYCGSGGTIVVIDEYDNEAIFTSVPAGAVLPVRVKQVRANSISSPTVATSATGIIALS